MDWKVKVRTQSGQIKDVYVEGYAYPEDAETAALAQTGASEVITITNVVREFEVGEPTSNYSGIRSTNTYSYLGKTIPGYELEFTLYILLGVGLLVVIPPIGFLILIWMSYRAIRLYVKNL